MFTGKSAALLRQILLAGLGLTLVLGLSGCGGGGADAAYKQQADAMNEVVVVLETITDDASADTAMPKLEKAVAKVQEANRKVGELKLGSDDMKKIADYAKMSLDAQSKMQNAKLKAMKSAGKKAAEIQTIVDKGVPQVPHR